MSQAAQPKKDQNYLLVFLIRIPTPNSALSKQATNAVKHQHLHSSRESRVPSPEDRTPAASETNSRPLELGVDMDYVSRLPEDQQDQHGPWNNKDDGLELEEPRRKVGDILTSGNSSARCCCPTIDGRPRRTTCVNVLSIHLRCPTHSLAHHASPILQKRLFRLNLLTSISRSAPPRPFSASIGHLRSGLVQLYIALLGRSGCVGRGMRHKIQVYDTHIFKVGQ
jgi:hypothetical protein